MKGHGLTVEIRAIESSYRPIYELPESHEFSKVSAHSWDWALALLEGPVVVGYQVLRSPPLSSETIDEYSRSGQAIMTKKNGGQWSTGNSPTNNPITRALVDMGPFLEKVFQQIWH